MITLSQMKSKVAKYAGDSGMCEGNEQIIPLINEARRILYPLGEWDCVMEPICIKPIHGRYVLPIKYEYAKEAYVCNSRYGVINSWYVDLDEWRSYCGPEFSLTKVPGHHGSYNDWGREPCKPDCNPEGFYIKIRFNDERDIGVILKLKGIGIRREDVLVTRTLTTPIEYIVASGNDDRMVKLTHVVKPKTYGWIEVVGYDGENEIDLAFYDWMDVNPEYTIYNGGCRQAIMKVKKRYRDLDNEDFDYVEFHEEAIIHTLQAISFRESKNMAGYTSSVQAATAFLNREMGSSISTHAHPFRYTRTNKNTGLVCGGRF